MNRLVLDALFIGLKEGVKLVLSVFLVLSYLRASGRSFLRTPLLAGVIIVFLASFAALAMPVTLGIREISAKLIGYVFGLFYAFSLGALLHSAGTDLLGPLRPLSERKDFLSVATVLLAVVYFIPDMTASSLYVADLASLSEVRILVFSTAGLGFAGILAASSPALRKFQPDFSRILGFPQLLLSISLIKLVGGGVKGFADFSLIPAVQSGLLKLIHDVVHQTFVLLLVPDHPVLSTTTWSFIGILFGRAVGRWLSLTLLAFPLLLFLRKHFSEPVRVSAEADSPAQKRLLVKAVRDHRLFKSIPALAALVIIAALWFGDEHSVEDNLYIPEAQTVVAENGTVRIPLQTPVADLRDGALHKYSIDLNGSQARILVMKKPDGTLAVCLDACEICPPEGYGQAKDHVVCLFCKTPIPFEALGNPGGCNPIPLKVLVTDQDVRISLEEITGKRMLMKSTDGNKRRER